MTAANRKDRVMDYAHEAMAGGLDALRVKLKEESPMTAALTRDQLEAFGEALADMFVFNNLERPTSTSEARGALFLPVWAYEAYRAFLDLPRVDPLAMGESYKGNSLTLYGIPVTAHEGQLFCYVVAPHGDVLDLHRAPSRPSAVCEACGQKVGEA